MQDPVLVLIAEEKRLSELAGAIRTREEAILFTLPEDIRRGPRVLVGHVQARLRL